MQTGFGRNPTYNFFYQYYFTIYHTKSQTFDGKYFLLCLNYFIKKRRAVICSPYLYFFFYYSASVSIVSSVFPFAASRIFCSISAITSGFSFK